MPLYLNLLPKKERKEFQLVSLVRLLQREIAFLVIILVFSSAGVFIIKTNLRNDLSNIEKALEENRERNKDLITDVQEVNQKVEVFRSVQSSFSAKSQILLELAKIVPDGIAISSLSLNASDNIVLDGSYRKRDDLLKFKGQLLDGFISDIDFPISNLLKQEDGFFVIKGIVIKSIYEGS